MSSETTGADAYEMTSTESEAVEAVIDFFVDTYRSTSLCFLQLVVQAGLAVLAAAAAEV
ncbi:hypothetical protein B0H13DRAFT_2306067 [Mycena leptocephala]|nr:hypothetical protein B0H13DRAFT_2306067 [Mycena leptocephala]